MNEKEGRLFPLELIEKRLRRFLAVRERASSEVKHYLQRKEFCRKSELEDVIAHLKQKGILNDGTFAHRRYEYRLQRGYGPFYIRNELRRLEIDEEIIQEVLSTENGDERFIEAALELISRRLPAILHHENASEKLRKKLYSRGYSFFQIRQAMENLREKYPHWGFRK